MIRIVCVDDHRMVREGLRSMLAGHSELAIVGEAADLDGAIPVIDETQPDVVLLDVRLTQASGLDACRSLVGRFPDVAVVMLTAYEDEQYVFEAMRAGARGYLLKQIDEDGLLRTLRQVLDGQTIVDPALAGQIVQRAANLRPEQQWPGAELGLTERESDVLRCVVDGLGNRDTAKRLFISEDTVKTHLRGVYRKLGVSDRAQAVSAALREGLFK